LLSDVTELPALEDNTFDAVHTGGGAAVWISDLRKYYAEAVRVLKPGGVLVVNEFHPFGPVLSDETPWNGLHDYANRGPFTYTTNEGHQGFEHHWTVADHVQAALAAGAEIVTLEEHDGTEADRIQDELAAREETDDSQAKADLPKLPRYLLIVARKR
jgi:SAM-dependent methyltransferase